MKTTTNMPLLERDCPCCDCGDFEGLWSYDHEAKTRSGSWNFHVCNVICKRCGFVFTSPAVDDDALAKFYGDSFSRFGQQALDYDVDKRVDIIKKHVSSANRNVFVEIGANSKTFFHEKLQDIFSSIVTVDPNNATDSEYDSMLAVPNLKADCLTHYFVLEHIAKISQFFQDCSRLIKDNGVMICEVPSLELYGKFVSPLILFEHVNHFTPHSLAAIAGRNGWELTHHSHTSCSRQFGFVAVFRKNPRNSLDFESEYLQNKAYFLSGLEKKQLFFNKLNKCLKLINSLEVENKAVVVWGANETMNRLFSGEKIPKNVTLIDSDLMKQKYFDSNPLVYQPFEKQNKLVAADHIVVCTRAHSDSILDSIKRNYNKTFNGENTFIIDDL